MPISLDGFEFLHPQAPERGARAGDHSFRHCRPSRDACQRRGSHDGITSRLQRLHTSNSGSSLATGTVDLIDDDSGSAAFSVAGMIPGQTVTRCILVTYQGTIANPGAVRLYSGGFTDSGTLGSHLNLTVEEGSGGTFASCAGFTPSGTIESGTLTAFNTDHTNYANGAGAWDPSSTPEARTYRITFQVSGAAPNGQQGQSVTNLVFTWETQS